MTEHLRRKFADRRFLLFLGILVVFGLVALTSASAPVGYQKFGDTYFFIKRQLLYGLLPGVILFILFAKLNQDIWRKISWGVYLLSVVLLILVFVPGVGLVLNGSRSWLTIGPLTFQPAEFTKLALILITAYLLTDKKRDFSDWRYGLLPALILLAPSLVLVLLQPDLGTLSIMIVIVFAMLYLARVPKVYIIVLGLIGLVVFTGLIFAAPYRVKRFTTFLHPELDPQGVGYHMNQAFLAVGSGGFWGLGLGHSRQKYQYLPEVAADSIYAVVAEEMGFVIAAGLVVLVVLLGWQGMRIAKQSPDAYSRLLVSGIMVWFIWQSFLNIGAMVGAMPLTGVPLPLVSHGGSAMMTMLAAMGIVAGISKS